MGELFEVEVILFFHLFKHSVLVFLSPCAGWGGFWVDLLPGTWLSPLPLRYRGFSGGVLKRREEIPPSSLWVLQGLPFPTKVLRFLREAMLFSLQGGQGL